MSYEDDDKAGQRRGVKRINNAVMLATELKQQYRSTMIELGLDDDQFQQTQDHTELVMGDDGLDNAVTTAYELIRIYLKDELADEFWNNDDIVFDGIEWPDGDNEKSGMDALEELPRPVYYTQAERMTAQGPQTTTVKKVRIPFDSYQKIIRRLDEARKQLGFAPTATKSVTRTEIEQDVIDDYEEWAQEALDEYAGDDGEPA